MTASLEGIPKNSNVYRFITAGKPGYCQLCKKEVQKLEAHHTCYEPEITIKLCHDCHHKVHFWPGRLNEFEKDKLLSTRFERKTVNLLLKNKTLTPLTLVKLIAPSRSSFVRKHQELEIKRISPTNKKIYKPAYPSKLKNTSKKVNEHSKSSLISDSKNKRLKGFA